MVAVKVRSWLKAKRRVFVMRKIQTSWLTEFEPKRTINAIIVHHTGVDTPFGDNGWLVIDRHHKQKGWMGIGYHFGVDPTGQLWVLRPPSIVGAHCAGHNANSLGIVVWGYKNKTPLSVAVLIKATAVLAKRFGAKVYFHNDLGKTICPALSKDQFKAGLLAEGVSQDLIKIGVRL